MGRFDPFILRLRILAVAGALLAGGFGTVALAQTADSEHAASDTEVVAEESVSLTGIEHGIEEAEHGGGLPQLDALTYPSQIFWLVVFFGTLLYLMHKRALPRVSEILEARQDRIASDLDRAARLRAEAEEAQQQYEQVVADAHAKAAGELKASLDALEARQAERQAELDRSLAAKLADAEARIASSKAEALAQLETVAAGAAQAAVSRLAGLEVSEDDARATLNSVLVEAA